MLSLSRIISPSYNRPIQVIHNLFDPVIIILQEPSVYKLSLYFLQVIVPGLAVSWPSFLFKIPMTPRQQTQIQQLSLFLGGTAVQTALPAAKTTGTPTAPSCTLSFLQPPHLSPHKKKNNNCQNPNDNKICHIYSLSFPNRHSCSVNLPAPNSAILRFILIYSIEHMELKVKSLKSEFILPLFLRINQNNTENRRPAKIQDSGSMVYVIQFFYRLYSFINPTFS